MLRRSWPLLCWAVSGCKCDSEKPYTPFGVASTTPASAAVVSAAPSASAPAPSGFVPRKAELAPGGVKSWNLGGTTIEAPADRHFEQGVVADLDGDGDNEIVAWLLANEGLPPGKLVPAGELWLFPPGAPARPVLPLPSFVPTGPGCKLVTRLFQTGPHSVTLDTRARCEAALMPRVPVGALAIVAPLADEPQIHLLRYAAEAPGEKLELSAASEDHDDDGKDDALVRVSLTVANKTAGAALSWFDRAAGASRDKGEPGRSLARAASRESGRAKTKKVATEVIERVALLRRLAALLCAEGGAPRLLDRDGSALRCDGLEGFVEPLLAAEIWANLAAGNVLEAFAAHSRDGWYFRPASERQRIALEKDLLAAVVKRPVQARSISATPAQPQRPRFSPLSFEPDGTLLVQSRDGVTRFGGDGAALETDPASAPRPWPLEIVAPSGARFSGVTYACDRSEIVLNMEGGREIVTRLLSPRPGLCSGNKLQPFPELAPIAFVGREPDILLGGSRLFPSDGSGALPAGAARSADGRHLVVPTRLGLLVTGGDKPELWQPGEDGPQPTALSDCVVANERRAVACLAAGKPVLFSPAP